MLRPRNIKSPIKNELKSLDSSDNKPKSFIPKRIYVDRDSLLTVLFKESHFNSLSNMFLSFVILMMMNTIFTDWLNVGFLQHFHHILWVKEEFSELTIVVITLLSLYLLILLSYLLVKLWINMRLKLELNTLIDIIITVVYLIIICCIITIPINMAMKYKIPPCSSAFIVYEQIRILMKIHAYMRTLIPKLYKSLQHKKKEITMQDLKANVCWKNYLYFMIIPTLIYRDSYPMRKSIDFKFAISSFMQFIVCIIFMYYVFINLMRPIFIDFNPTFMTLEILIPKLFQVVLPAVFMMLTVFFCFLHLWLNTFAELTKFGDRQFYKDWWNATSLSDYFRTWNALIHDWLYTYIYRDFSLLLFKITNRKTLSKSFGMINVLLISALVHEYVLAFCFRFFYPVLLTVFFFSGCILYFIKANRSSRIPNIMLWTGLYLGNSIFVTLYSCEWYARRNCKRTIDSYWDFIVPRSLFCELSKNITS